MANKDKCFGQFIKCKQNTHLFYKQHFYKQRQVEIGKKSSKS